MGCVIEMNSKATLSTCWATSSSSRGEDGDDWVLGKDRKDSLRGNGDKGRMEKDEQLLAGRSTTRPKGESRSCTTGPTTMRSEDSEDGMIHMCSVDVDMGIPNLCAELFCTHGIYILLLNFSTK
ncbi:hypothetical protein EJ04DRAFT_304373 [Polyplosphaeria fusca]|uniref:Uncharacterized protein n=1 Tax=Polyplosphaeria fusca TaxID=682080 RepID=A0A9P4QRZ4_9PLEO|nr:hypothetical protein EJ04DRAFT_304373 [Polyplosphaeria fusca]